MRAEVKKKEEEEEEEEEREKKIEIPFSVEEQTFHSNFSFKMLFRQVQIYFGKGKRREGARNEHYIFQTV